MKSFRRGNAFFSTTLVLLACLAFFSLGCSTLSKMTTPFNRLGGGSKASSPDLKKKVGVMPLENRTDEKGALDTALLEARITGGLVSACPGVSLVMARDLKGPSFLTDPPKKPSGALDGLALAYLAREEGFNLVLFPILASVHHEKQSSWWNWLVKDDDLIGITVRIEVYDTHTGAKIFHDNFIKELEINAVDSKKLDVSEIMALPDFESMSSKLAKTLAKTISREINAFPWKGFIVGLDGKAGILSSGSNIGLKEGQELSLSKDRDVITGFDGNQYLLPGPVLDRVKVVEVGENRAKVVSGSGLDLEKGNVVQATTISE